MGFVPLDIAEESKGAVNHQGSEVARDRKLLRLRLMHNSLASERESAKTGRACPLLSDGKINRHFGDAKHRHTGAVSPPFLVQLGIHHIVTEQHRDFDRLSPMEGPRRPRQGGCHGGVDERPCFRKL
jgi:hypothetical protein